MKCLRPRRDMTAAMQPQPLYRTLGMLAIAGTAMVFPAIPAASVTRWRCPMPLQLLPRRQTPSACPLHGQRLLPVPKQHSAKNHPFPELQARIGSVLACGKSRWCAPHHARNPPSFAIDAIARSMYSGAFDENAFSFDTRHKAGCTDGAVVNAVAFVSTRARSGPGPEPCFAITEQAATRCGKSAGRARLSLGF